MGKTFQRIRLCSVGKLRDADKIPQWVRAHGGEYTKTVDSRTTHLVTTKEAYKENVEAVNEAKSLKTVKVVSFDWLEESLLSKTRRPLKETPYLWSNLMSKANNSKIESARVVTPPRGISDPFMLTPKRTPRGSKVANRARIYQDPENGDRWEATLVRTCKPPRAREKFKMAIFQSIAKRPTYSAYAKYSRMGISKVELLAPAQRNPSDAIKAFLKFFEEKTGKEWDNRSDGVMPSPRCDENGKPLPPHEGWYSLEMHTNIFTDFIKSYKEPTGSNEAGTPNHALLESLLSAELNRSASSTPEIEGGEKEGEEEGEEEEEDGEEGEEGEGEEGEGEDDDNDEKCPS